MEQIILSPSDAVQQLGPEQKGVFMFQNPGGDAHIPGFLGKGTVDEANQLHLVLLPQLPQQRQHVGLCSAHVAAGDQMHDFHGITPA